MGNSRLLSGRGQPNFERRDRHADPDASRGQVRCHGGDERVQEPAAGERRCRRAWQRVCHAGERRTRPPCAAWCLHRSETAWACAVVCSGVLSWCSQVKEKEQHGERRATKRTLAVKVQPSPFRDRPAPALTRRRPAPLKVGVCSESCGLLRSQDGRTFADVVSGAKRTRAATSAVAVEPKASRKVKESGAGERRHISSCMAVQL